MNVRFISLCGIAAASIGFAQANLISNGGFETGDTTDWTYVGFDLGVTSGPDYAHSGTYGVDWGQVGSEGILSQNISTVIGDTYQLSFWYSINDGPTNEITAFENGNVLFDYFDPPVAPGDWINVTEDFTATTTTTDIAFGLRQDPGYSGLDDVSVNGATTTVPGPAALAPFGIGLLGLLRRKNVRR